MKKLLITFGILLFINSIISGQNIFNYQIKAKGGISVGTTGVKIDSITVSNDTITFWNSGSELFQKGVEGQSESDISEQIADSLARRLTEGTISVGVDDVLNGSTGNNLYMSPSQVYGYISSGGDGEFTGDILEFIIGTTTGAPSASDTVIKHSAFKNMLIDVIINKGVLSRNTTAKNYLPGYRLSNDTIYVKPALEDGDRVEIRIRNPLAWSYLSLEGQESALLTGLSAFYKCDEISGDAVNNSVEGAQDGKMWTSYTTGADGKYSFGKQIGYRGVMSVSYNTNISPKGSAYSVAMWVYLDTVANQSTRTLGYRYYYLFAQQHNIASPSNYPHRLWIDGATADSNKVFFKTYNNAGTPVEYSVKSSVKLHSGQWYHIAAVNEGDGETLKLYVNGVDVSASAGTFVGTVFEGLSTTRFGNEYYMYRINLAGNIDDIGIWSKGLSAEEVLDEMVKSHPWE